MTDDDPEEQAPTPAQLLNRAKAAEQQMRAAREAMLTEKCVSAALAFTKSVAALRGARAALPPLRLVSSR